ncbi:MAG: DMT family transporter [Salinivirgaceae bacterium]|nr:DMT family transporter [Salinivirgaceae bacterium]MDD4746462.1 DMT family transporter [Salinivirgaceae bacterium]MDY0281531.1 DMT family transporter [Salinivirgaceae bacterium]
MKKQTFVAYLAIITAMLFWSLSFVWYKEAYKLFTPISVIFIRLLIASILLSITALTVFKIQKIDKRHYKFFLLLAFFEPFLYFMAEGHGINYTSATVASVIVALIPLLTPFATRIFLKTPINNIHLIGLVISFGGVGIVVSAGSTDFSADSLGIGLMFMAVLSALGYSIVLVKLMKFYNTITIITFQNILAVIFFLPFFLSFELDTIASIPMTLENYSPVLKLSFFASFLAFSLFVYSIKRIGITIANMFTYLIPAFTALFAFIIIKETLSIQAIIGIMIVIFGLALPHLSKFKKQSSKTDSTTH